MSPHATFRLWGPDLDPAAVTASLGILPSHVHARGEPRNRSGGTWPHGMWYLSSGLHVPSEDLEAHLAWILDRIEPAVAHIEEFRQHENTQADLFCYWEGDGNGGVEFNPVLLGRIAALGLKLGIDIAFAIEETDE